MLLIPPQERLRGRGHEGTMKLHAKRTDWVKAALLYFLIVFGAGFALGSIRTLWVVPEVGVRVAELIEMPFMIAVTIIACRSVIRLFVVPSSAWPRLGMGLLGLAMMVGAEIALSSWLFGRPVSQYFTSKDPVSGAAYFLALGLFAILPVFIGRRVHGDFLPTGRIRL
jgi:hypothetical protein